MKGFCILIGIIILSLNGCQNKSKSAKYSDEINSYNYLDKEYENIFIYDFENLLNNDGKLSLLSQIKNLNENKGVSFIFISEKRTECSLNALQNAYVLRDIFKEKFSIDKIIIFVVGTNRNEIAIVYDDELQQLTPQIVQSIIDSTIIPQFKLHKYTEGIIQGSNEIFSFF